MPVTDLCVPGSNFRSNKWVARYKSWNRTPSYPSVPKEELPVNGYEDRQETATQGDFGGAYYLYPGGPPVTVLGPGYVIWSLQDIRGSYDALHTESGFDDWAGVVSDQTLLKALSKVADLKANLAVSAAEAKKTSDMIVDRATRILNAARAFRRGNFRKVASLLNLSPRTVHKTWLEYKYGWMPFLLEVKGAAEFFAQQSLGGRPPRFSVQAKDSQLFKFTKSTEYSPFGGGASSSYTQTLRGTYTVRKKLW
jgi:hypothetical protein